ncbi:MAG: membrane dipeptidase [Eggerthellaceae bacterium]|nr:membrane dipeptidase [Eggerthellaceae bacterium]
MNQLGIFVDVSHLSDAVSWDIAKHSKALLFVSQFNACSCCVNMKNLTEGMI